MSWDMAGKQTAKDGQKLTQSTRPTLWRIQTQAKDAHEEEESIDATSWDRRILSEENKSDKHADRQGSSGSDVDDSRIPQGLQGLPLRAEEQQGSKRRSRNGRRESDGDDLGKRFANGGSM